MPHTVHQMTCWQRTWCWRHRYNEGTLCSPLDSGKAKADSEADILDTEQAASWWILLPRMSSEKFCLKHIHHDKDLYVTALTTALFSSLCERGFSRCNLTKTACHITPTLFIEVPQGIYYRFPGLRLTLMGHFCSCAAPALLNNFCYQSARLPPLQLSGNVQRLRLLDSAFPPVSNMPVMSWSVLWICCWATESGDVKL